MTRFLFALALLLATGVAQAQTPAPAAPPQAAPAAAGAEDQLPTPPADFSYTPGGRRDPFMTLTSPKVGPIIQTDPKSRPLGAAGILVDELSVKGIVLSNGAFVAMVAGPAGKSQTYTVKAGSKLYDGVVRAIDARSVVIVQQVSDPLSLQKQREVRKLLRTQEEGK